MQSDVKSYKITNLSFHWHLMTILWARNNPQWKVAKDIPGEYAIKFDYYDSQRRRWLLRISFVSFTNFEFPQEIRTPANTLGYSTVIRSICPRFRCLWCQKYSMDFIGPERCHKFALEVVAKSKNIALDLNSL